MDPRGPRRSPRLQAAQRPQYAPAQESRPMNTPGFHSSSSVSSMSSLNTNLSQSPTTDQSNSRFSSAPLPSPSQNQSMQYFPQMPQQNQEAFQQQQYQQQYQQMQQPFQQQQPFANQQRVGAPDMAPYFDNFNLVAEAAKRAQMACLMRDFGDVEL